MEPSSKPGAPRRRATIRELGGWRGLARNPGLFLFTLRHGGYVGEDTAGNRYYETRGGHGGGTGRGAPIRRWVVYKGQPEASTVTPQWHAWLHYTADAPLQAASAAWARPHLPNLTGTAAGYRPVGHDYQGGRHAHASGEYEAWSPDS